MFSLTRRHSLLQSARRAGCSRERGSVIVLVIVTLTLLTLMGAVYLQSMRVQRFPVSKTEGDIRAVEQSCINLILATLKQDLTGDGEYYDHPWTNQANTVENQWDITLFFSGNQVARGGDRDDAWLASSEPDFSTPGSENWPHITNLVGHFLSNRAGNEYWDLSNVGDPSTADLDEDVVNFTGTPSLPGDPDWAHWDTRVPLNNVTGSPDWLVDADGDGIGDSRWAWAPITQINGVMYTMAVRIVDLSAKVNVNTALSLGQDSAGNWQYAQNPGNLDAPQWRNPAELDFGRFAFMYPNSPTATYPQAPVNEIRAQLNHRLAALPNPPGPPSAPTLVGEMVQGPDRERFWRERGRKYADPDFKPPAQLYNIADLHELLHRNGINENDDGGATFAIEGDMDSYLRENNSPEAPRDPFAVPVTGALSQEEHFTRDVRHHLTTLNGAAIFAPRLPGETGNRPPLKLDINEVNADFLSEEIFRVFGAGNAPTLPSGLSGYPIDRFADQLAANIADYRDNDDNTGPVLTGVNRSSGTYAYGFEYLPMISEVYVQGKYQATAVQNTTTSMWDVTWDLVGELGFAIEIRNPYMVDLPLNTVELWVDGGRVGPGFLSDIPGVPATLPADGVLVLYADSDSANTVDDEVDALIDFQPSADTDDLGGPKDIGGLLTWNTGSIATTVDVELRASVDEGSGPVVASWPYARYVSRRLPTTHDEPGAAPDTDPDPTDTIRFGQIWSVGEGGSDAGYTSGSPGDKLQIITVEVEDADVMEQLPQLSGSVRDINVDKLGEASKGGGKSGTITSPGGNQVILPNDDFWQVGELAHLLILPLDGTQTIAQAWNSASDVREYQLVFAASANPIGAEDRHNIPHAQFLIERFTTLDARIDGEDNDGDGSNSNETLIPGLVNLNTVPYSVLKEILPIADDARRDAVAQAIVAYRDGMRDGSKRSNPGIASLGELFARDTTADSSDSIQSYALVNAGDTAVDNNVWIDNLLQNAAFVDNVADDAEEQYLIARWLAQVGSVRSDYYVAYIKISGWAWPGAGPAIENSQFLVVIRRNAVSGEVAVKAIYDAGQIYRY